jgi:hypothetical protein
VTVRREGIASRRAPTGPRAAQPSGNVEGDFAEGSSYHHVEDGAVRGGPP